jgi:hypothetical protein
MFSFLYLSIVGLFYNRLDIFRLHLLKCSPKIFPIYIKKTTNLPI